MRTFLFSLFILLLVGGGIWYRYYGFPSFRANDTKTTPIAPVSEWKSILQGTWGFRKEYKSPLLGCIDEGDIEFKSDGTFFRYSNVKRYQSEQPVASWVGIFSDGYQWYTGGGNVVGNWTIDTLNESITETIDACNISRHWIRDRWKEDPFYCKSYYAAPLPIGNFQGADEKRWVEKFNSDSIIVRGRNYNSDMDIFMWFKKRK